MNIKQHRRLPEKQEDNKEKITKIAIGVEGGIESSKRYIIDTNHSFVYLGPGESPIKEAEVQGLMKSIVDSDSASKKAEIQSWELQIHACEHTLTLD